MAAGVGVGVVAGAVAVAELDDPTQVESSHLALQTRAIWSLTEKMFERGESAAVEATG